MNKIEENMFIIYSLMAIAGIWALWKHFYLEADVD